MEQLREQLVQLLFRVRNLGAFATTRLDACPAGMDINMTEFLLLRHVAEMDASSRFGLTDMQKSFGITKSGASKMLAALEKKGCLLRDTDRRDRRNLVITLTNKGYEAVRRLKDYVDAAIAEYVRRVGEKDLQQAITIFARLEKESNAVREAVLSKCE